MPATWPASLQDFINEESFSLQTGSTVLVSDMDIGPAKKRRRFTKSVDKFDVTITLKNQTDYTTFSNFFDLDLNGGVEQFVFDHPLSGVPTNFRMSEPKYTPLGGTAFLVSMQWESMP